MIFLVYLTIALVGVYFLFSFLKENSRESINKNANLEKTPEEMVMPIYRPFKDGSFQMTMGLQSLDLNRWIEIDKSYCQQIRLKQTLLSNDNRNDLFMCKDETYSASIEVLQMLIEHLPYQYPNMFEKNHSNTKLYNLITNQTFNMTQMGDFHPLEMAAYLVQEDLIIMQRDVNQEIYHANALAVCFPSGWLPKSKFGLPLAYVHMPHVPFFEEKLRMSMEKYFIKLKENNPVQRLNWTLQIGDKLCQKMIDSDDKQLITNDNAGQLMYLRVERQTLRRLPKSNTILFTIKTYLTKIEDVCRNDPLTSKRLAGAIRNWPNEMIKYKGAGRYKNHLLAYLDMMSSI